jgi:hypothetical protein
MTHLRADNGRSRRACSRSYNATARTGPARQAPKTERLEASRSTAAHAPTGTPHKGWGGTPKSGDRATARGERPLSPRRNYARPAAATESLPAPIWAVRTLPAEGVTS